MHLGSKQGSEASFSFQINDAVKGDEEYLLADDDFLRDVNDCTLTTPLPPSRTVLERGPHSTLVHLTTRTDGHDASASASSPPKPFAPSSPTRANAHHHEAAVTKRLKTPKPTFTFPSKPSTPKTTLVTRSTVKWPSPSKEMILPRPEASPAVARLTNLRAEIEMLGESNGLSHNLVQQQQEGHSSNKRTESGNRSPFNSNMPAPTKIELPLPIEEETLIGMNEPRSGSPLATQSAPVSEREPHTLGSSSLCDNNYGLVSPGTNEDAEITEPRDIMNAQNLIRYLDSATNPDGSSENRNKNSGGGGVFDRQGTGMVTKDNREDNPMAPLTLSQLSPRKIGTATDLEDHVPAPSPPAAVMTSPMRVARKRPVSAITADHRDETSKKGKVVPRVVRNQVTDAENSDTQSLNRATRRRNIAPNRRGQGAMVKRSVGSGSGSGSRLKSSRLSSSGGATVSSASLSSSRQSRKVVATRADKLVGSGVNTTRTRGIVKQSRKRVVKTHVKESDTKESDLSVVNEPTMSLSTVPELSSLSNQGTGTASTSHLPVCSTSCDDNDSSEVNERITQEGATSHVNATKSGDFQFQFRLEERTQPQIAQNDARMKLRSYSRSQAQPGSNVLKARNSASMSSSLSNSRVIGSMTRSQFRYTHYRPVPDYKSQHALLESSLAQRKENIAPVLPLSFELHTDARAKERERFDAMVKEKEMEMEQEREAKRREREEQEEQEVRELRRRAVPKANAVPEWYKNAPRRKKTVEEGQDSEN